jgi:putative transcriptional regulator
MVRRRITNRELSKLIGIHENSVSRLKAAETMPRLDGVQLNTLCVALECSPSDLLEYTPEQKEDA